MSEFIPGKKYYYQNKSAPDRYVCLYLTLLFFFIILLGCSHHPNSFGVPSSSMTRNDFSDKELQVINEILKD